MELFFGALIGAVVVAGLVWARGAYAGFRAQAPEDYAEVAGAEFDVRRHLNGRMACDGVIFGPTGRVTSRFVAEFVAEWDGNRGIMREHFRYDSGTVQDREWQLEVDEGGRIRAEADDLVGTGLGQQKGPGIRLGYAIRLPDSAGGHVLNVVDWMYLLENGTIMNRSQFSKFGIKVAELVATIRPVLDAEANRDAA